MVNTARPLVSASSAALTHRDHHAPGQRSPGAGDSRRLVGADQTMSIPHPPRPLPLRWPTATPALDHYFAQLPPDVAAEPPLTNDTAQLNAAADDATDRFYEDLAQDAEAELCEV